MNEQAEIQIEELLNRIDDLRIANQVLLEKNNNFKDALDSFILETTMLRHQLKEANSIISRLRNHIAQGIEL